MKRVISRSALWAGLSLLLIAAAISVGQSAGTMLGDAEAQALIRKYQGQPATPLTRIETQNLLKYLIAKSANPSAHRGVAANTIGRDIRARDCAGDSAATGTSRRVEEAKAYSYRNRPAKGRSGAGVPRAKRWGITAHVGVPVSNGSQN